MPEDRNQVASRASCKRVAHQIVDMSDPKRKEMLQSFSSDMRCRIVEEMVNIRLQRLRTRTGAFQSPAKISPK